MSALRTDERFAKFFKGEPTDDGSSLVADALLEAFSTAAFEPFTLDIDIEALHQDASRRLEADDQEVR